MTSLPPNTTLAILGSVKLGHVLPCLGVAHALGIKPEIRPVKPGPLFHLVSPWGPADPRDNALDPPYPDIVLASGRETAPYLRAIRKRSGGKTFTVFLGNPRNWRRRFHLICLPEHDRLSGRNVFTTLTAPHPRDARAREEARANPHPAIAVLPSPRVALLIGGPSRKYSFEHTDIEALATIAAQILESGASLMVSPSRRTPQELINRIRLIVEANEDWKHRTFLWDGSGENPYMTMLAMADYFVVTTDSVNMIGESIATGKPVHVYEPTGHAQKFGHFINELLTQGTIRPWAGHIENWTYKPIDSTPLIAREIAQRFAEFRRTQT